MNRVSAAIRRGASLDHVSTVLAVLYLALLPMNIPLRPPVYLEDLLGPLFALILVLRGRYWRYVRLPDALLALFLVIAALTTVVHFGGWRDLYEWAIFGYMGVLYWYFAGCRVPARWRLWLGLGTLLACVGFLAYQWLTGTRTVYQVYEGSTLGFMAKRFFFTFTHPNLAASYFVLPVVLVLTVAVRYCRTFTRAQWAACVVAACVLLVPLVMTVSRHMLLTGAVGLGFLVSAAGRRRWCWIAAFCVLGVVFALFYLTVIFPFFPLRPSFPFFNHATFGMYTIHQVIYLKIVFHGITEFFMGVGKTGVRTLYPQLADWASAHAILAQYKQAFLTPSFVTYMDAHNEFLNLSTDFGVPAMACCMAFWVRALRGHRRSPFWPIAVFFVIGVLLACLWDDLFSKRWIWVSLGILTALLGQGDSAGPATGPVGIDGPPEAPEPAGHDRRPPDAVPSERG